MLIEAMLTENGEHREPDLRLATVLAGIHAVAFAGEGRPWSGPEILALLGEPVVAVRLAHRKRTRPGGGLAPAGFALYRAVAGEAELLTIPRPGGAASVRACSPLAKTVRGQRARRGCSWKWPRATSPPGRSTAAPAIANAGAARAITSARTAAATMRW